MVYETYGQKMLSWNPAVLSAYNIRFFFFRVKNHTPKCPFLILFTQNWHTLNAIRLNFLTISSLSDYGTAVHAAVTDYL